MVTFGSRAEANHAGAIVQAVHTRVNGVSRAAYGPFPAGTRYSAEDPELMLWVHATLVYASLSSYQRFEHKLTPSEQESYYQEMGTVARIFGTPSHVIPASLDEFRHYFAAQLEAPEITVTEPALEISRMILRAPVPPPMRLLAPAHRLATRAQLPPRLRAEYGLAWNSLNQPLLTIAAQTVRLGSLPALRVAGRLRPPLPAAQARP
jgi:uncharacterized protein (DUF2236 family)